jgi:hypothetical protein
MPEMPRIVRARPSASSSARRWLGVLTNAYSSEAMADA